MQAALENPWVRQWLAEHPNAVGEAMERKAAAGELDPRRAALLEAMSREREKRWEAIGWETDGRRVLNKQRPILVEVVVGRMASANNGEAC